MQAAGCSTPAITTEEGGDRVNWALQYLLTVKRNCVILVKIILHAFKFSKVVSYSSDQSHKRKHGGGGKEGSSPGTPQQTTAASMGGQGQPSALRPKKQYTRYYSKQIFSLISKNTLTIFSSKLVYSMVLIIYFFQSKIPWGVLSYLRSKCSKLNQNSKTSKFSNFYFFIAKIVSRALQWPIYELCTII